MATIHDIDTGSRASALEARDLSVHYGEVQAITGISLVVPQNQVVAQCCAPAMPRCTSRI